MCSTQIPPIPVCGEKAARIRPTPQTGCAASRITSSGSPRAATGRRPRGSLRTRCRTSPNRHRDRGRPSRDRLRPGLVEPQRQCRLRRPGRAVGRAPRHPQDHRGSGLDGPGRRAARRFAAAVCCPGLYHVLWPTNSQDNPQNQAKWFVDEVVRVAPWMVRHRCPVLQGDFELFSNFVPYRAPTIIECNRWMSWVAHYWARAGGNPPAIVAYAPYWLYGTAVTGLDAPWWASSYVPGSGNYHNLYPGNDAARWEQVPGHPAVILQYTDAATFPGAAAGVDANAVRGVSTAAELQALLIGGTPVTDEEIQAIAQAVWARGLTYPGGLTIAAGTRLATVH